MRLPVQLWKYSCAMIVSTLLKSWSVAVSCDASTALSLKMLRPLFSMAPMLKCDTATIMKMSRSYSRPNACSSQRMARLSAPMAYSARASLPGSTKILDDAKRAADESEQIARLGERIVPRREMTRGARDVAGIDQVPVGEQHRGFGLVGLDAGGEHRHHIRPVREICDAAESFRLALRRVGLAGPINAHQLGVGRGVEHRLGLKHECTVGRLRDRQAVRCRHVGIRRKRLAVELDHPQLQFVAIEHHRRRRL